MFKSLLDDAGLTPELCAGLLDVDVNRFSDWALGKRELPGFIVPELASVLGVSQSALVNGSVSKAPAVWYKFRGEKLREVDRELVILIRRLGFYVHQLNSTTGLSSEGWQLAFAQIRSKLDLHRADSPTLQGERAADVFRSLVNLGFSHYSKDGQISGPGDVIRGILRSLGVLIIEMPVPESNMDGCSFYVGDAGAATPCLFINTYRQRWFRRNYVLAHELAHAIFDIDGEAALIDYRNDASKKVAVAEEVLQVEPSLKEERADAFARALFASGRVLASVTAKLGLKWDGLSVRDLALIVAHSQVELSVVLRSALDLGLVGSDYALQYGKQSLKRELRTITERVLTPSEFFSLHPERAMWSEDVRTTTIPSRKLLLPVPYVMMVINALNDGFISDGKAAEMLMMDIEVFLERFSGFFVEAAA